MNNVHAVALRSVGSCLRSSQWPKSSNILVQTLRPLSTQRQLSTCFLGFQRLLRAESSPRSLLPSIRSRDFSTTPNNQFQPGSVRRFLGAFKPEDGKERGLTFGEKPLTAEDLQIIFGDLVPDDEAATRLLRVVHGRRVDGTLDLPLPEDLEEVVEEYPEAFGTALGWLRANYPVDEEEAILARIEREESGYDGKTPSQLRQRAQDLRLYTPQTGKFDEERDTIRAAVQSQYVGPQSGRYQAKLSEKGDLYGESQIDKIREENEAKFKQETEELEQQIEEIQARRIADAEAAQSRAIAARPEQGIEAAQDEIRPPNEFEKWVLRAKNKATSKLTLDSPEIMNKTVISRLFPSFIFAIAFCVGCWWYAQTWKAPKRTDRLFPNVSLSFATIGGIMATNVAIFLLWRFPPAWGMLNKYFLAVPALPRPISLFGNIFSHTQPKHLLFNMVPLVVFGPSLHEDLGRGNFLALYLASGVLGSFASLAHKAVNGVLYTSSLGASGSVWAVTAAFFNLHSDNDFTIFFMPEEWKEQASIKGWMLFSILIGVDIIRGFRGKPVTVDYVAHAGGALTGWLLSDAFKWNKAQTQVNGEFVSNSRSPWWQVILQRGENQDKGSS